MTESAGRVLVLPAIGRQTGLGHVIRCRGVARELAERGWLIDWKLPATEVDLARGLDLPGHIDAIAVEPETALLAIQQTVVRERQSGSRPGVVIVDSYQVDSTFLQALHGFGEIVVLFDDGVLSGELSVDLLINPSPAANPSQYAGRTLGQCLCGTTYAAVDPAFLAVRDTSRRTAGERLLVSFGGSDPLDLTRAFVALIESKPPLPAIPVDIVRTGAAYPHAGEIRERVARLALDDVRYHHNVRDMAAIMRRTRLALAAAGSTLFELAVCGVPVIPCVVTDNQWPTASWLAAFSAAPLFDLRGSRGKLVGVQLLTEGLLETIRRLWVDSSRLQRMRERLSSCCDGRGALRIADAIEALVAVSVRADGSSGLTGNGAFPRETATALSVERSGKRSGVVSAEHDAQDGPAGEPA